MHRSGPAVVLASLALVVWALPGAASAARLTCGGVAATIVGTTGGDTISGTGRRDVIVARGGDDVIDGRGGDDVICGGPGSDRLRGGPGNDRLFGQRDRVEGRRPVTRMVGDVLRGGPGNDLLSGGSDPRGYPDVMDLVIYDTARRGVHVDLENGTATGQGHDRITGVRLRVFGSPHDDLLVGAPDRSNYLAGLGGNDRVVGGNGFDNLFGDSDRPTRVSGNDRLNGRGDEDRLVGGPGNDVVRGGGGPDNLQEWDRFASGADRLLGGPGDDTVQDALERGTDQVFDGGSGTDSLVLTTSFTARGHRVLPSGRILLDRSFTTYGRRPATGVPTDFETVYAPTGGWRLVGTAAAERLWASRHDDPRHRGVTILGRGGDDNIIGTHDDDVLDGGPGTDLVCGRGGDDTVTNAEQQEQDPILLCDKR